MCDVARLSERLAEGDDDTAFIKEKKEARDIMVMALGDSSLHVVRSVIG